MKQNKVYFKSKKIEKPLVTNIQTFLKRYAENCRYSFNKMLRI